jgi:hypothetical protein
MKLKLQMNSKPEMRAFLKAAKPQQNEIIELGEAHIVLTVDCQWMTNSPFIYSSEFID